jgi:hypothetical protein
VSKIVLVQDNLSTHKPASLYEAFPAAEARRLVERFEWHYTPRHGSWLDMAESELSVLSGQCLDRRIPDKPTWIEEVAAWEQHRNKNHTKADRQFTTADARIKPKRLYPQYERLRTLGQTQMAGAASAIEYDRLWGASVAGDAPASGLCRRPAIPRCPFVRICCHLRALR